MRVLTSTARRAAVVALASALIVASPRPARAEIEVGGFVGAHFFSEHNELGRLDVGRGDLAPQHMALPGLRLSYLPVKYIGFEGEVGVVPTWTRGDPSPATPVLFYREPARQLPRGPRAPLRARRWRRLFDVLHQLQGGHR